MATITITDIGTEETTIPMSDGGDIIIQTLVESTNIGSYIVDHSLAIGLENDDHPQYLNISRGDSRYSPISHQNDTSIHYGMDDIVITKSQISDLGEISLFTSVLNTKLAGIESGAEVNNISDFNAGQLINGFQTDLHYHDADRLRENHTGTQGIETLITTDKINDPTYNINLRDILGHFGSSGIIYTGSVSHVGDGYISLPYTEFYIRSTTGGSGVLYSGNIQPDTSTIQVLDGTTRYIYIDYNAGTPVWASTLDPTEINLSSKIPLAIVSRSEDINYHVLIVNKDNQDSNAKLRKRLFYSEKFKKASGGVVANPSGLQIEVTGGDYWFGLSEYTHLGLVAGGIFKYYYLFDEAWYVNQTATSINGTQFNNTSIGLSNLSNKYYANHWIYAVFNGDLSTYAVIYGQAEYTTLIECINELPPISVPDYINSLGYLVGVVTVYEDTGTIVSARTSNGISGNITIPANNILPSTPPTASNDIGTTGTVTWDANYIYVCVNTNTWKRVAIAW